MRHLRTCIRSCDPVLLGATFLLTLLGLVTMFTFEGENVFFTRQAIWIGVACAVFFAALVPDYRFLRAGHVTFFLFLGSVALLVLVLFFGETVKGAQSRFDLGFFSVQPSDPAKLVLIALLAKYFSKRHEVIGDFKHILISGAYAFVLFALIFVQPDFGSAIIIFCIWFGMVLVSGISLKHLAVVTATGAVAFALLWQFGFQPYQKERIVTFLNPLADIQGAGYNAYQSTIAVGSGQWWGKGIGYGTQSKLQFLPEYETDFIFAAFAEEWGLVGVVLVFALFAVVVWRLVHYALAASSNFERLFASGVAVLIISHFTIHVGMNIGLLPVTGTTIPFLSYGGSHLVTEYLGIAMVIAMGRYAHGRYEPHDLSTSLHTKPPSP